MHTEHFARVERDKAIFLLGAPIGEVRSAADEQTHIDFIERLRRLGGTGYLCDACGCVHLAGDCSFTRGPDPWREPS